MLIFYLIIGLFLVQFVSLAIFSLATIRFRKKQLTLLALHLVASLTPYFLHFQPYWLIPFVALWSGTAWFLWLEAKADRKILFKRLLNLLAFVHLLVWADSYWERFINSGLGNSGSTQNYVIDRQITLQAKSPMMGGRFTHFFVLDKRHPFFISSYILDTLACLGRPKKVNWNKQNKDYYFTVEGAWKSHCDASFHLD